MPQAVDWLGRVEHFEDDVEELFQLLNARSDLPQLPAPGNVTVVNAAERGSCTQRRRQRRLLGGGRGSSGGSGSSRQLAGEPRNSTFNPCDPMDYFRWVRCAHGLGGALHCCRFILLRCRRTADFMLSSLATPNTAPSPLAAQGAVCPLPGWTGALLC